MSNLPVGAEEITLFTNGDGEFTTHPKCREWTEAFIQFAKRKLGESPTWRLNAYIRGATFLTFDGFSSDGHAVFAITIGMSSKEIALPEITDDCQFDMVLPGIIDALSFFRELASTSEHEITLV